MAPPSIDGVPDFVVMKPWRFDPDPGPWEPTRIPGKCAALTKRGWACRSAPRGDSMFCARHDAAGIPCWVVLEWRDWGEDTVADAVFDRKADAERWVAERQTDAAPWFAVVEVGRNPQDQPRMPLPPPRPPRAPAAADFPDDQLDYMVKAYAGHGRLDECPLDPHPDDCPRCRQTAAWAQQQIEARA